MRTPYQARRVIQSSIRNRMTFAVGWCKKMCGTGAYDIPSDGTPDAKTAYQRTMHRFNHLWIPGAFAWWSDDTHWHVAICCWTKGMVFSTDILNTPEDNARGIGRWYKVPLTDIARIWPGHKFVGFSRDINGKTPVRVPLIKRAYP